MVRIVSSLALALAVVAQQDPFNWQQCSFSNDPRLECGSLRVALDHLNSSANLTIDIAGNRDTRMATRGVATYLGDQHDVQGFDPRGIGQSRPARCTKNGYTATKEWPSLSNLPFDSPTAETSLGSFGATLEAIVRRCEQYDAEYLRYLSTSFVARDLDLIRAALNESVVNYYGVSYGTTLGATYVNMFPNRVGRVLIDSVLGPSLYTGPRSSLLAKSIVDADATFDGFAKACEAAGLTKCLLALEAQVGKRVREFLAKMVESPLVLPTGDDFSVLTAADVRSNILNSLYSPSNWLGLAHRLHSLMQGTYQADPVEDACPVTDSSYLGMDMDFAIYIGNDGESERRQDWHSALHETQRNSPLFGMQFASYALGPWNAQLRQPILIMQNKLDPVTPLRSAQALARTMGANAVLVTRDGFGHDTCNTSSQCIQAIVTSFLTNGTYPKPSTNCKG